MADGEPNDDERLMELYKVTAEEYRFQIDLNWRRSQYFLVLPTALLVATVGLLNSADEIDDGIIALLFGIGIVVAILGGLANATQRQYYRSVRDAKQRIERDLGIDDRAARVTYGSGSARNRLGRVTTFQTAMLGAIALADAVGVVVVLS